MNEDIFDTNSKVKTILCYGDSNTWGWVPSGMGAKRYNSNSRWPGVLQKLLGLDYKIIEEGLGARTTMFDDPRPELLLRNGLKTLPIVLETHNPLNLVIIMLGTTDAKEMMNLSIVEITEGMRALISAVKNMKILENTSQTKILVVVPAIVKEDADFASALFKGATEKTTALIDSYKALAKEEDVFYLNPNDDIAVDKTEGVHIDNHNHIKLGELVANKVKEIFS